MFPLDCTLIHPHGRRTARFFRRNTVSRARVDEPAAQNARHQGVPASDEGDVN